MFYCVPVLLNEFPHGDNKVVALAAALWLCQFSLKGHWVTIIMVHFKLPCGVPSQSLLQNIQSLENKQFLMTRTNLHYKWMVAHSAVISNTHTHTFSLSLSHTHTYTFSHTHTLIHIFSLTHMHKQTHTPHAQTHSLTEHVNTWRVERPSSIWQYFLLICIQTFTKQGHMWSVQSCQPFARLERVAVFHKLVS